MQKWAAGTRFEAIEGAQALPPPPFVRLCIWYCLVVTRYWSVCVVQTRCEVSYVGRMYRSRRHSQFHVQRRRCDWRGHEWRMRTALCLSRLKWHCMTPFDPPLQVPSEPWLAQHSVTVDGGVGGFEPSLLRSLADPRRAWRGHTPSLRGQAPRMY